MTPTLAGVWLSMRGSHSKSHDPWITWPFDIKWQTKNIFPPPRWLWPPNLPGWWLTLSGFYNVTLPFRNIFSSLRFSAALLTRESPLCVRKFLANFFLQLTLMVTWIIQWLGNNLFSFLLFLHAFNCTEEQFPYSDFRFFFFYKMI